MRQTSCSIAALFLAAAPILAQTKPSAAIPATEPTLSVSDLPSAQPHAVVQTVGATRVTWNGALLTIEANGEPMPEVLGRVARETGMKITGGVPDEHLYGKYGPASVQSVMGQLFDGLAVNMMLVNESPTRPKELILTSRTGSATPPSTREASNSWQPSRNAVPIAPIGAPAPPARATSTNPSATSTTPPPTSSTTQPAFPALSAPPTENNSFTNTGNADTTPEPSTSTSNSSTEQPQSPNGVKTPEQIFEELRKRAAAAQSK